MGGCWRAHAALLELVAHRGGLQGPVTARSGAGSLAKRGAGGVELCIIHIDYRLDPLDLGDLRKRSALQVLVRLMTGISERNSDPTQPCFGRGRAP